MKTQTACFTGHRNIQGDIYPTIKNEVTKLIMHLAEQGIFSFLNGGARGFDLLCAHCVLDIKKDYPQIKLRMILPCKNQTKGWAQKDLTLYSYILRQADEIIYISNEYHSRCMFDRNDYMIAHSSYCIAYLYKQHGGTAYTVMKAQKEGLHVHKIACS